MYTIMILSLTLIHRPDMTFAVDLALKINYLSIAHILQFLARGVDDFQLQENKCATDDLRIFRIYSG